MHVYSTLQTQLKSLDERCSQLLKQCAILADNKDLQNNVEHLSSFQTQPKQVDESPLADKIKTVCSHVSSFECAYDSLIRKAQKPYLQPATNIPFAAPGVAPPVQYSHPSSQLTLEKFDGDFLKYHTFKRKFKGGEEVYQDFNIRMSFLKELERR